MDNVRVRDLDDIALSQDVFVDVLECFFHTILFHRLIHQSIESVPEECTLFGGGLTYVRLNHADKIHSVRIKLEELKEDILKKPMREGRVELHLFEFGIHPQLFGIFEKRKREYFEAWRIRVSIHPPDKIETQEFMTSKSIERLDQIHEFLSENIAEFVPELKSEEELYDFEFRLT